METSQLSVKVIWGLCFYFVAYILLTFVNLSYIPVAWIDETYFFDPAIQFLKTGKLVSNVWHTDGTEKFVFSYLPFMFGVEIINLSVFPWEMFYVRLPFVMFFFAGMYFLFRLMKDVLKMETVLSLIILFLFINDKGTSEGLRSVRVEVFELFFISFLLWRILTDKNDMLSSFFLSFLFLCHPKSWALVAVLGLFIFFRSSRLIQKIYIGLAFLLPVILYLAWGNFDFKELYSQLILHAGEHDVESMNSGIFYNHFIARFWPFYKLQPYVPVMFYLSLFISAYTIYKKRNFKNCLIEICFLISNIYWFINLGAFTRYNSTILIFSYLIVGMWVQSYIPYLKKHSKTLIFSCIFVPAICFPFLSRHAAAIMQREERDIKPLLSWYETQLKGKISPALLIGESSLHYFSLDKKRVEYGTFYSMKKFRFSDYKEVYVCSVVPILHTGVKVLAIYKPHQVKLIKESGSAPVTYYGTTLYKLETEEAFQYIKTLYE